MKQSVLWLWRKLECLERTDLRQSNWLTVLHSISPDWNPYLCSEMGFSNWDHLFSFDTCAKARKGKMQLDWLLPSALYRNTGKCFSNQGIHVYLVHSYTACFQIFNPTNISIWSVWSLLVKFLEKLKILIGQNTLSTNWATHTLKYHYNVLLC